ncbi:TIM barrel protein [Persicobacter psychrovividus]|uniref:L-rhamnose catabolism isomerase n=1 Tax=Persicobacter psychrovividus TaxID=387638 RepID=A0ABM7VIH4_9BACT|nr:L-rhamnose catabolism isomerase [Persicobacter psychrovividus]
MDLLNIDIPSFNNKHKDLHQKSLGLAQAISGKDNDTFLEIIEKVKAFQVAIPSWALGTGGTRFGRFSGSGEPSTLEEKISDIGLLHAINRSSGAVSMHIPWDQVEGDGQEIKAFAEEQGIIFDAVNSNTFQDQPGQEVSYKFGSLCNVDPAVRAHAVAHMKEVIDQGVKVGSKALTVWLSDGSNFPGQLDFKGALARTEACLKEVYDYMPEDWTMLVEYKPYEPNFYSTVISDWGTSFMLANALGERAKTLVDLGHHLPNTNIEQIVAVLLAKGKLGGFHFNDSKYGDDDVTVGALKPYQLFLIFCELVKGMNEDPSLDLAWMIDASHNIKDPLEDILQSVEAMKLAYAQALLVDYKALEEAQANNDVTLGQEILQAAFRTDARPIVAEARMQAGGAFDVIKCYREAKVRAQLTAQRGTEVKATGL